MPICNLLKEQINRHSSSKYSLKYLTVHIAIQDLLSFSNIPVLFYEYNHVNYILPMAYLTCTLYLHLDNNLHWKSDLKSWNSYNSYQSKESIWHVIKAHTVHEKCRQYHNNKSFKSYF